MSKKSSREAKIRAALAQVPLVDDDTEDHTINHENLKGKGNLDTSFVKDTPEADEVEHIQHNVLENAPEIIELVKNEDPEEYVNISELQTSNVVPPENSSCLNKKDVIEWQRKLDNTNTYESKEIGKDSRQAKIAAALAQISLFDDSFENHSISHENQKREGNVYIASLHNTHFVKVALEADKMLSLQCNRMENCSERVEYINVNKDSEEPVNNHELQTNNVDHPENRECLNKKDMIEKWQGNLDTSEMKLVTNAAKEKEVKSEPEELKIRSKSIYIIENEKHVVTEKEEVGKKTCTPKNTVENAVNEAKPLIEHEKTEEIFKKELELFHCPFTWNLNYKNHRDESESFIARLNEKLEEIEEDTLFQWHKFILSLIICHELYICGNFSEALSKQRECELLINEFELSETPDKFFQNVKKALSHVVDACKCHLLLSLGLLMDARKLKGQISSFEEMNDQSKAAIFGIQSAVLLEYGYDGTKAALAYAEKAVKLDENEGEWYFLLGKILGRIRRVDAYNEIPTSRELSALERAVETTKRASYMVFLAQAYREAAFRSYAIYKNTLGPLEATLDEMNAQSQNLYRKALEANGECAYINIRCAQGFLKLPWKFRDVQKAKECIDKALKRAPCNAMVNHVAGFFNERFLSNIDLAEKYYRKAAEKKGAYGACMDVIRINFLKDSKYNPLPDLEQILQDHRDLPRVLETTLQMGTYCYLFKNDLLAALNYWMKVIETQPESEKLQVHKCSLLQMKTPMNLYQVIVHEIQLTLKQESLTAENMLRLHKILHTCTKKYPELLCSEPQCWRELVWEEHSNRSHPHVGQGKSKVNQHRKDIDQSLCHEGGFGRKGNRSHNQENGNERGKNLSHYNEKRSNRENDKLEDNRSDSYKRGGIQRYGQDSEYGKFANQRNSKKGGYNTQESRSKSEESCRSKSQENKWKMEGRKGGWISEMSERKSETYRRSDRSSIEESVGSNSEYNSKLKNGCISHDSSVNSCDSNYGNQVPKRGSRYTSNRSGEDKNWKSGPRNVPLPNEMLDLKQTHTDSISNVDRTPNFIPTLKGSQKNVGGIRNWNQRCYEGSQTETHTHFSRNESWQSNGKEQQRLQGNSSKDAWQPKSLSSEQETNLNRNREYETKYGKNRFGKDQASDKILFVTDENMWKGAGDPAMGFRRRRDDLKNKDKMHH